ncbi:hypothetical protein H257_12907 [Aphanomyces astaci]|uniref:Uncharacterized protein n=1 Tax=Aphanomyces astaci TaxID=112090 RepID=W4FYT7_APHAT|nr:hypothetical protein H257_12907 [Aphanomyces astaci]ETV72146.1 hypothetical protein H257_12907 [Aphanomyces astaci]|eukprot:XP_009838589.1 hypothetical protein H257_12907 [Aphanomyces astaci]
MNWMVSAKKRVLQSKTGRRNQRQLQGASRPWITASALKEPLAPTRGVSVVHDDKASSTTQGSLGNTVVRPTIPTYFKQFERNTTGKDATGPPEAVAAASHGDDQRDNDPPRCIFTPDQLRLFKDQQSTARKIFAPKRDVLSPPPSDPFSGRGTSVSNHPALAFGAGGSDCKSSSATTPSGSHCSMPVADVQPPQREMTWSYELPQCQQFSAETSTSHVNIERSSQCPVTPSNRSLGTRRSTPSISSNPQTASSYDLPPPHGPEFDVPRCNTPAKTEIGIRITKAAYMVTPTTPNPDLSSENGHTVAQLSVHQTKDNIASEVAHDTCKLTTSLEITCQEPGPMPSALLPTTCITVTSPVYEKSGGCSTVAAVLANAGSTLTPSTHPNSAADGAAATSLDVTKPFRSQFLHGPWKMQNRTRRILDMAFSSLVVARKSFVDHADKPDDNYESLSTILWTMVQCHELG